MGTNVSVWSVFHSQAFSALIHCKISHNIQHYIRPQFCCLFQFKYRRITGQWLTRILGLKRLLSATVLCQSVLEQRKTLIPISSGIPSLNLTSDFHVEENGTGRPGLGGGRAYFPLGISEASHLNRGGWCCPAEVDTDSDQSQRDRDNKSQWVFFFFLIGSAEKWIFSLFTTLCVSQYVWKYKFQVRRMGNNRFITALYFPQSSLKVHDIAFSHLGICLRSCSSSKSTAFLLRYSYKLFI